MTTATSLSRLEPNTPRAYFDYAPNQGDSQIGVRGLKAAVIPNTRCHANENFYNAPAGVYSCGNAERRTGTSGDQSGCNSGSSHETGSLCGHNRNAFGYRNLFPARNL